MESSASSSEIEPVPDDIIVQDNDGNNTAEPSLANDINPFDYKSSSSSDDWNDAGQDSEQDGIDDEDDEIEFDLSLIHI